MSQSYDTGGVMRASGDRIVLTVVGHGAVVVHLSGTWVGTLTFQGSVDGASFFSVNATPVSGSTAVTTATATGAWVISAAGLASVAVLCSAYSSGGIGVMLRSSPASAGSSGGGGGGGGDATAANQVLEIADLDKLAAQILDYDTGGGTANQAILGIALPASGGPVGVSATNPLPTTGGTLTPADPIAATVGVASAQALAADATRKGYDLVSTSSNYVSFGFGAHAAVLYSGITLSPFGSFRVRGEIAALAINAIASAAASNLGIQAYT